MFELFQYTVCRLLALDRCKFVSASVMRLRENVARAIIPAVRVQPRFSALPCVPSGASLTTSQRSERPFLKFSGYLDNQGDFFKGYLFFNSNPIAPRRIRAPALAPHLFCTCFPLAGRLRTFESHLGVWHVGF